LPAAPRTCICICDCVSLYLCVSVCGGVLTQIALCVCVCFKMQQMRQINATIKLY